MKRFVVFLFGIFLSAISYADTCTQSQIDLGNGECVESKFSLTTSATDSFQFALSAVGTFYVDCGNGGSLTGTGVSGNNTITRSDTDMATYTCSYDDNTFTRTIRFAGQATGYTAKNTCAIGFNVEKTTDDTNAKKLTGISGSLGSIFSTVNNPVVGNSQPTFSRSFFFCSNLTGNIPENLFTGIHGTPRRFMFYDTFAGCSGLTGSIPEKLFCQNPKNPNATNCIYGAPKEYIFSGTFIGCSGLTGSIPENLFVGIFGAPAQYMFSDTFNSCFGLTGSIPENLFSGISGTPAENMFANTFKNTRLSGYIPPSAFAGLVANGSPYTTDMWTDTFKNTKLATTCPTGKTQYITGYEDYWNGKVSCVDESFVCDVGTYFPAHGYQCEICPVNSVCSGGTYNYSETTDQGIVACSSGTFAPTGSAVCYPHILHVGNDVVYLKSTKQTTPSLNLRIGGDVFYANMITERTRMSKDSSRYLHINLNDIHYYVCDDTTRP